MISVQAITSLHRETVARWHQGPIANACEGFLNLVCEQHMYNFLLWHEEDVARSPDIGDARIVEVKRAIDRYNQKRNDWIEQIDEHLLREIQERGLAAAHEAPLNTETPGCAIDRLSILALRIYHMEEQEGRSDACGDHRASVRLRLRILTTQHHDLSTSLQELLDDVCAGRKRLKLYRQMKMYNDPAMNPYLHRRAG
ncbi:MAG: DUF4254 domain-containing protein [Planctomycetes bacterium]|nr:DUF4254 domain-containing protein [Planctomycetota bacterium]